MTQPRRRSISASLRRAHVAIDNTMNVPAILDAVAEYGYSQEQMEAGRAFYEAANAAVSARTVAAGARSQARRDLRTAEEVVFRAYQKISEIAKAVYRGNRERLVGLGLDGPMPRVKDAFLMAAFKLFDNAPTAAALTEFGYTAEHLTAERAKIVAYQEAANEYQHAIGAAQLATQHQDAALDAMNRWTDQYLRIARAVLRDEEQLLEKIGLPVRNRRTAVRRQAGQKAAVTRAANREPEPV